MMMSIFSLEACAQKKTTSKAPTLTYLRIHRTVCFGRCPSYSIEVYANGLVRWSGLNFTDHQGVYEKKFSKSTTQKYLKQFAAYRPDTCSDEYNVLISDIPGLNYSFNYNNDSKDIFNAHFGPDFLKVYATSLDNAFHVDRSWKRRNDTATIKYKSQNSQ